MTTRSDLPRLAGALAVLGTELEAKGETVWNRLAGWETGPTPAPAAERDGQVCVCNHTSALHVDESGACTFVREYGADLGLCWCIAFVPAPSANPAGDDARKERKDAARAAEHFAEFRSDLAALDALVQSVNRRIDMACPPDVSELRNRRTGELTFTDTATDVLTDGWCPNCWSAGVGFVPLSPAEGKSGVRRYADRCRPCGDFRKNHGNLDKPKALVVAHADNRRMTPEDVDRIIKAAQAEAKPKKKGKKGKRKAA